jgi:acyl-CoA hydrolase
MPAMPRGPRIDLGEANLVVEAAGDLIEVASVDPDATGRAIAAHVAALIPDDATLQIGIGSAPAALWRELTARRGLRLHSGLASEDVLQLADCGALADKGHVAGILAGSQQFYREMAARDLIRLADTLTTHDATAIAAHKTFFAANSALSVDLFGQVNVEWQGAKALSGIGGAPDFAAAASASPRGRSITMLPSTARGGTISRIVARLDTPTVSLARNLADVVATEHGTALLRDKSLDERAEALIAIAAPAFQDDLGRQWREMRKTMAG